MEHTGFALFVIIYSLVQCYYCLQITNIDTDQSALLALKKHITSDPYAVLSTNWTTNASVCAWTGVVCNTRHKRVASLVIPDMGIVGTLPPDLGNLSFLVELNIGNNRFHGNLPPEMARLRRLRVLNLTFNALNGSVPSWFGSLTSIQTMSLRYNSFAGSIPPSISNASKLEYLDLSNNNLKGRIPSEIGKLESLRILYLYANNLSGSVPPGIFNSSLEALSLGTNSLSGDLPPNMCLHSPGLRLLGTSHNSFTGNLPSGVYNCKRLEVLSISFNSYSGSIPNEIGNMTALKNLFLGHNQLTGEIPQQLDNLVNLKLLDMATNLLEGQLPSSIFNISSISMIRIGENRLFGSLPLDMCNRLPLLEELVIGLNEFTGAFPRSIGNCTFLRVFSAVENKLTGEFPSDIGNLRDIEMLEFGDNRLSGFIPEFIYNASKLRVLDLGYNLLDGFIPSNLHHLENIEFLQLGGNNLTVESNIFLTSLTKCLHLRLLLIDNSPLKISLPQSIGDFPNLETLNLAGSKIVGNIPVGIGNLSNLLSLSLQDNDLIGTVPQTIGHLPKIQSIDLRGNKLQGHLPAASVCGLSGLVYLLLSSNQLSGSLPACLGKLTSLREIQMGSNRLTSIPIDSVWKLKDLLILNLSSNLLAGKLPAEIGNLKVVNVLDLSRNQLSGEIPSTVGNLRNLVNLSLAENSLSGSIPQPLGRLTGLELLNLSSNKFTGIIPKSFEKLSLLHYLDLSFNELEGEIPQGGPFTNFTAQSFLQNRNLCGLQKFHVRPCSTAHHRRRSAERMVTLLKYILPALASFVIMALVLLVVYMRWQKRDARITTDQENPISPIVPKRFSQLELQRATNGFAESNLLGKGGFSSVYKGTLPDETTIAVKVFDLQVEGSLKSFHTECEFLRNVRHRNLVKVIGSCSNLDFKALVIDYMPNGSLEKWLREPEHERLSILQRMNIMIDVASALGYLHHGYSTVVVHCDVKPSNVLLDEEMVAHLGDYGIAKLFGEQEFSDHTKTLATIGYISPEYGSEGIVSAKGDVYSYGITLLEIFTRMRPTDERLVEADMNLKRWVMESLPHGITDIADPDILEGDENSSSVKENCLKNIMELALHCCAELPEDRVDIKEVNNKLKKIKELFWKA